MKERKNTYSYEAWNQEAGKVVEITITLGKDGVTQEWLDLLEEMDHNEANEADRWERLKSQQIEALYRRKNNPNDSYDLSPIQELPDVSEEYREDIENERVEKLREKMQELTDKQRDLIYDHLGMDKYFQDIANEENVTRQAVRGRYLTIVKKLAKLMEE